MVVYLLSRPSVLSKLKDELEQSLLNSSTIPSLKDIEPLPYLSAVISETLRFSIGVSNRQTRISPDEIMVYHDGKREWKIPPGVCTLFLVVIMLNVAKLPAQDPCRNGRTSHTFQSSCL
jgi:cytochrome P450